MKRSIGIRPILEARGKGKAVHSLALACLLLGSVGAGAATAAAEKAGSLEVNPNNFVFSSGELTNPEAAEELPRVDLGRDEALELVSAVFPPALQNAAGIYDELDVEKFHADNVAVIATGEQPDAGLEAASSEEPTLLTSTTPLATKNAQEEREAVDLSLEHVGGELQPVNPLVDLGIPGRLDQGISLPDVDIEIEVSGAPDRAPSIAEKSTAFYPNVAQDTDLIVAPTPGGVETLTQLRSPEAPLSQTFDLSLPSGADLIETEGGGAKVIQDGKAIVVVPPPTAYDAEGVAVPVRLNVLGGSMTITAAPAEDSKFPILVDPLYEQPYVWMWNHSFDGMNDWKSGLNSTATPYPWAFEFRHEGYIDGVGFFPGLSITSTVGTVPTISRGRWIYYIPRYQTDYNSLQVRPTSYVKRLMLKRLWFKVDGGLIKPITASPALKFGIWNEPLDKWTSQGSWTGTQGNLTNLDWEYVSLNPDNQVGAKYAKFELDVYESQLQYRHIYVGEAAIELSDSDAPEFASFGSPAGWLAGEAGSAEPPLNFTAVDPGLGVKEMVVKHPNGATLTTKGSCTGIASNACPRVWSSTNGSLPSLKYAADLLPQGENYVMVEAVDPIGKRSPEEGHGNTEARIRIDRTRPRVALSGSLTNHAISGTKAAQYTLKYDATDGSDAGASALYPFGGTGGGQMLDPQGIAVDNEGNIWVVDRANSRVQKFDQDGNLLLQFGSSGSANGQLKEPRGIAVSDNGTVWVAEIGNKRVQAFTSTGQYIRKVTYGSFSEPWGVATGPGGEVWVADGAAKKVLQFSEAGAYIRTAYGNSNNPSGSSELAGPVGVDTAADGSVWVVDNLGNRVVKFSATGKYVRQFGSGGTSDGKFQNPVGVTVAPSGNVVVADGHNNRIQVFQPNGVYLRQFGTTGSADSQLSKPRGLAITSSNFLFIADGWNHRIARWDRADLDPQSGVASTEVKVDNHLVEPKYAPGCATKSCAISREWTLDANGYGSGQHEVSVTATDGVGRTATNELTITTDATAPQLNAPSQFFTAPEGWLEQKSYSYSATATDAGGYGLTSLELKIDGKVVKNTTQGCPSGGCSASISGEIDMAAYKGGAHPAELVARDAAGNIGKKTWTINIDPKGAASLTEVVDTLEAVEATSAMNIVGESQAETVEGTAPGLGVDEVGGQLAATGTQVPLEVDPNPANGATMEIPERGSFAVPCSDLPSESMEEPSEALEEGEGVELEPCLTPEELESQESEVEESENWETFGLTPIQVEPISTAPAATEAEVIAGNATVSANTGDHVDTVIRPLSDGGMTFENIRDSSGPEEFSWSVDLEPGQELKAIDDKTVQVYYDGGHPAFVIKAMAAHDAVGTAVATKISIAGANVVTLTVEHRNQSFVYPVIAGTGWQGGYQLHIVEMPPPEPDPWLEAEFEIVEDNVHIVAIAIGPAVADTSNVPFGAASPAVPRKARAYNFNECGWARKGEVGIPPIRQRAQVTQQCHGQLNGKYIEWAMSMSGVFHYKYGHWVWTNEPPVCRTWGPSKPHQVHCFATKPNPSNEGIDIVGDFRFPPHVLAPSIMAYCYRLNGRIPIRPGDPIPGEPVFHGYRLHNPRYPVHQAESCPWGNFPHSIGR